MFRDLFDSLRGYKDGIPNRFTISLGKLIREARLEANLSQSELAEKAYFSQTAISQIEQGKRDISAAEILYFSAALDKPILYFYQNFTKTGISDVDLSPLEQELLAHAKRLSKEDLSKLIAQTKALVDLNHMASQDQN
jgi:transcriptional regulator with XRE-family HTH domain